MKLYTSAASEPKPRQESTPQVFVLAVSVLLMLVALAFVLYSGRTASRLDDEYEILVRYNSLERQQLDEQKAATEQLVLANGKLLVMLKRLDELAQVAERNL